jgi:hypothetical protein
MPDAVVALCGHFQRSPMIRPTADQAVKDDSILEPSLQRLEHRVIPKAFTCAYLKPLLKKADLDSTEVKSYQLVSNLPINSKLLERLVGDRLNHYLKYNNLLPDLQLAHRMHYSTVTPQVQRTV